MILVALRFIPYHILTQARNTAAMSTSTDAAEPFLKDSKNGDGETTEDWDYNSPRHRHNVRRFIWLVTGTFVLVFTNATTYFLFGRSNGSLDMTCAAYTSETWCKSG